jgi:hypothetical protein
MRASGDHGVLLPPDLLACLQPQTATGGHLDLPLKWHPEHIRAEAIDQSGLCAAVPEGDAKEACREDRYGEAVMWAEPEIAAECRAQEASNDISSVAQCAKRKFLNAWTRNGMLSVSAPASAMPPACGAQAPPERRAGEIRDRVAAAIRSAASSQAARSRTSPAERERPRADQTPAATSAPAAPLKDEDEAWCDYMAREVVRGELTPSPATAIPAGCRATIAAALAYKALHPEVPFAMDPDETDREIARMLQPRKASAIGQSGRK